MGIDNLIQLLPFFGGYFFGVINIWIPECDGQDDGRRNNRTGQGTPAGLVNACYVPAAVSGCLLYTSDAADDVSTV